MVLNNKFLVIVCDYHAVDGLIIGETALSCTKEIIVINRLHHLGPGDRALNNLS